MADGNDDDDLRESALGLLLERPEARWEPLVRKALDGGLRVMLTADEAELLDELLGERHPNVHVPVGQ